jgi:hypothetical protein
MIFAKIIIEIQYYMHIQWKGTMSMYVILEVATIMPL